ncbi:MAG: prepilin-type N-terminal cleavage/methylation domain-containing protein [Fibrobacterota bacterium]
MKNLKKLLRDNRGFTLTELMIVIVIIGILASIGIPRFMAVTTRAKAVEFKPLLQQIYSLEENYYSENDTYTPDLGLLGFDDPKAKYFTFTVTADSNSFTATATCSGDLKGEKGESLRGQMVSVDQNEEHRGDMALRRIARW